MAIEVGSLVWLKSGGRAYVVARLKDDQVLAVADGTTLTCPTACWVESDPNPSLSKNRRTVEREVASAESAEIEAVR